MSAITSADGFHHLVYSISGTTHTLFLDGSAVSVNTNGTNVFSTFPNISNMFIGTAGDLSYGYTGYIDELKVFNRALTITDVSALYYPYIIPPFIPQIIDTLSTAAYNAIVYKGTRLQAGAFGVKLLLYSAKSNPVIQIKAGTGGTPTDFYAPTNGTANLTTAGGTGIVAFLNGAVGYVTKWYDQTGNGNHGTAQGSPLPFLNTTTFVVDFGTSGFFSLSDGSFPSDNKSYSYVYKQGRIVSNFTVYSGGNWGIFGQNCTLLCTPTYNDAWYAYDFYGMTPVLNSVVAATYGGAGNNTGPGGKKFYINNVLQTPTGVDGRTGPSGLYRGQTEQNCFLGACHPSARAGYLNYQSTMPYFYWLPYQLGSADISILGST